MFQVEPRYVILNQEGNLYKIVLLVPIVTNGNLTWESTLIKSDLKITSMIDEARTYLESLKPVL
jgi:hypothetical protein